MDTYKRHLKIWRFLHALARRPLCRIFNMTHEDLHVEGPVLLVPNHVSAWDPLLVAMSLRDKQVYYVASEHIFRLGTLSRLLVWALGPIPRKKGSQSLDTVRACVDHLKAGHSVCLFAEGEQCWDGKTIPVFPATAKLVRMSGATLVTYRLEGGYLSLPRWGRGIRRGKVHGHPVRIYPPEELKAMRPDEITRHINEDIFEDAWERQKTEMIRYRGRKRAEGMERALYLCPSCKRISTLKTEKNRVFCSCGFETVYTETGFFEPAGPFANIAEWEEWQKESLHRRDFICEGNLQPDGSGSEGSLQPDGSAPEDDLLFSDEDLCLVRILPDHRQEDLGQGTLLLYEDRLVFGTEVFPLKEITDMALVQAHLMLFSFCGSYYQFRASTDINLRKYLEIWREK